MDNKVNIELRDKKTVKLNKLAKKIQKLVKDEIRRQDLIDTGKMLRNVKAKVTEGSLGQMEVEVTSTDYFKYVNGNFNIMPNVYNTSEYRQILLEYRQFKNTL